MDENPAFGLGFGRDWRAYNPEIATGYDPFPVRAPHNFNITVFSRMGIVGSALWVLILAVGIGGLYLRAWRYRYPPDRQQELAFWIMFITCTWLNSTFGVLMEGPVLGVWFWFAIGFAWARSRRMVAFQPEAAR
jgi:O-antigen ligase